MLKKVLIYLNPVSKVSFSILPFSDYTTNETNMKRETQTSQTDETKSA